jgi:hypothetical protein
MADDDSACAVWEAALSGQEDAASMSSGRSSELAHKNGGDNERFRREGSAPAGRLPWSGLNNKLVCIS